jgi:hypothetical protein
MNMVLAVGKYMTATADQNHSEERQNAVILTATQRSVLIILKTYIVGAGLQALMVLCLIM